MLRSVILDLTRELHIGKVALQSVDAAFLVGRELKVELWNDDLAMF